MLQLQNALLKLPWTVYSSKDQEIYISYMIAKEKLMFTKMKLICELEENHGVNLGVGYKIYHASATFVSFIAKKQKNCLLNSLSKIYFF